ncbi:EamA family transporter [Caldithrix abyssi]|nr:EamA family transporter [Caldithrix abyssi]
MIYLLLTLTILFWASAFVGIRAGLDEYNPIELAILRFVVASVILLIISRFIKLRLPAKTDLLRIFSSGITGITLYNIALNFGELSITAGEASFIVNTVPIFTTLLAYLFLKETISQQFVIGMGVSFLGVTLIVLNFSSGISLKPGVLAILLAAISQAVFFVLQKPLLDKYRPLEITSYAIWIGTLLMLPFGYSLLETVQSAHIESTIAVVYLGIFPGAVAYLCWASVLSKMNSSTASLFLYLVPVVTLIMGYLWLKELPVLLSIIGGVLALAGVAIGNFKTSKA